MSVFKKIKKNLSFLIRICLPIGKKALLLGTCEHENLGDSAIAISEKLFLMNHGFKPARIKEITYSEYIEESGLIKRYINKNWLICGLGGGSMGNEWFYDEEMRRSYIKDFPNNRIIIFPQTIFYTNDEAGEKEKKESIAYYKSHTNLVLTAREKTSYNIMKSLYPNTRVILSPDIVLSTDLHDYGVVSRNREGVLLAFRKDVEKSIDNSALKALEGYLTESHLHFEATDTNVGVFANKKNRFELVRQKLQEFAESKLVITDRLHGMVFAAISGTPCIVFSNYNHKVLGTYEWIKDLDYIKFANTVEDAIEFIPQLMKAKSYTYDKNMLMPFFEDLKNELENI